MVILHNNKTGNNWIVAKKIANLINCKTIAISEEKSINIYEEDVIIFILSNTGDEEISQPMEDFLYNLNIKKKKYAVCELINYFGLGNYCGCKKVLFKFLDNLGWKKLSDLSLDSVPNIDEEKLNLWIESIKKVLAQQKLEQLQN